MTRIPRVLSIAGSDSAGCAGIQADLKTLAALGCHGMSAITSVTAQDTLKVYCTHHQPARVVELQMSAVLADCGVDAVKTGMLPTREIVEVVSRLIAEYRIDALVVDPVTHSSSGEPLVDEHVLEDISKKLMPLATVVTPNLAEAAALVGFSVESEADCIAAAHRMMEGGIAAVVIKGGHRQATERSVDLLVTADHQIRLASERIETENTHGSGCTFAAAIAAHMAFGNDLVKACQLSKRFVSEALKFSFDLGRGSGPLGHFHETWTTFRE